MDAKSKFVLTVAEIKENNVCSGCFQLCVKVNSSQLGRNRVDFMDVSSLFYDALSFQTNPDRESFIATYFAAV